MKINRQIIAALAIIFNDKNEILFAQRNDPTNPNFHEKWGLPGGMVEIGESPDFSAAREAKEEVGIDIEIISKYPIIRTMIDIDRNNQVILLAYPSRTKEENSIKINYESKDARWFKYEDIDDETFLPFAREFVDEAKKII
ncbi:hypothetical protein LBMAG33_4510 [Candidatus Levyibacteriota bacterium]|nr:NUDIX hydrolase [Candidatus Levybacteria bacterium]MSU26183.1 NUDIX hydrolase [Candidatus Levybacteria bacterium]GDX62141.1 hypothetical protein LBMAG33_4510 [Candidatus Levybacteria bacterium]